MWYSALDLSGIIDWCSSLPHLSTYATGYYQELLQRDSKLEDSAQVLIVFEWVTPTLVTNTTSLRHQSCAPQSGRVMEVQIWYDAVGVLLLGVIELASS